MDQKKIGLFLKELRKEKDTYTKSACRTAQRI